MRKKILLMAAVAIMTTMSTMAQIKLPAGMRMEVAESDTDNSEYSIFTYKDTDSDDSFGYYLSLGRVTQLLGLVRDDITDISFDDIREICICLGSTADEALASLDNIIALYDNDVETTTELQGRSATGSERLGDATSVSCIVKKKPLGGKRLQFLIPCGKRNIHVYLNKSVVKELKQELKIDKRLHPKQHR